MIDFKKKFIVGILTAMAFGISTAIGQPEIADGLLKTGLAIIAALGLEDFGKAAKKL